MDQDKTVRVGERVGQDRTVRATSVVAPYRAAQEIRIIPVTQKEVVLILLSEGGNMLTRGEKLSTTHTMLTIGER